MGAKIRKRGGKWYVFVNYHGRRKAKCVGTSRQLAEQVKRQLEAKLALGDLGFLTESSGLTFEEYSQRWLKQHAEVTLKQSTIDSYSQTSSVVRLASFWAASGDRNSTRSGKGVPERLVSQGRTVAQHNAADTLHVTGNTEPCGRGWHHRAQSSRKAWTVHENRKTSSPGGSADPC